MSTRPTSAIISLLLILHVILVFMTGHSTWWWLARGFDALEAAQIATAFCLYPWWRRWRRQFSIEWARLSQTRVQARADV